MAAGTTPIFIATPRSPSVRISTANTNRDGTGTLGTVFTASAQGAFFPGCRIQSEATNTNDVVRLLNQDAGAGNNELKRECLMPATTGSTTLEEISYEWYPPAGIMLSASSVYKASTDQGKTYSVSLEGGGDF